MSSKPGGSDEWSYRHRVTDILVTVRGPHCKNLISEIVDMCGPLQYEVCVYFHGSFYDNFFFS